MGFYKRVLIFLLAEALLLGGLCGCNNIAEISDFYPDDLSGSLSETIEPGLEIDLDINLPDAALFSLCGGTPNVLCHTVHFA